MTTNHEGAKAYKLNAELELYSLVCTASLQNKFYESSDETMSRLRTLVKLVKPEFIAKLAVYAREQMYLRSIPLVLVAELAKIHSGDNLVSKTTARVIQRADEITEILGYYQQANDRSGTKKLNKLSKQIQLGIGMAFNKFSEYQFAKYNRAGSVTLKDALFLSHAKPNSDEKKKLFKKIVDENLAVPYTWEVELSKGDRDKKVVWEELIDSNKLGYMALMRNCRNFLEAEVSQEHIIKIAKRLSNKNEVVKARQFPFRFLAAYQQLQERSACMNTGIILNALEDAMIASAENIEGFGYETGVVVACDVSASMWHPINPRSKIQLYDIGLTLGMLLQHKCKKVMTGIFGSGWLVHNLPQKSILQNVKELHSIEGKVGYSTNGYKVIEYLNDNNNTDVDKVMIFTDCQLWDYSWHDKHIVSEWAKYKKINPKCKLYLFDLAGYGNTPLHVNDNDVFLIAGWSDKIFNVLKSLEQGKTTLSVINDVII